MVFCSILIPVYRGDSYVYEAIRSCLEQTDKDVEVIVSVDDANGHRTIQRIEDDRLKIYTHDARLGMLGNYRFLISKATGTWITILGQDDGLLPFAVQHLRNLTHNFPDLNLITSARAYANWPDCITKTNRYRFIYPLRRRRIKLVSSRKYLRKITSGRREYSEGPQLYTGTFSKRNFVDSCHFQNNIYSYPIPDVASAVRFLLKSDLFLYYSIPLFWVGTSASSTGKLIDVNIENQISEEASTFIKRAFQGDNADDESQVPGDGVFTSFSWYCFEALRTDPFRPYEIDHKLFRHAIASLRVENKLQISLNKEKLSLIISENDVNLLLLMLETNFIRVHRKIRFLFRMLLGVLLYILGRLLLVKSTSSKFQFMDKPVGEFLIKNKIIDPEYLETSLLGEGFHNTPDLGP